MIEKKIKVNGEYYTAPIYNEAIAEGHEIWTYPVQKMWGIGTPTDLEYFLENFKKVC